MDKRLIYTDENGTLCIVTPVDSSLTLEEVAKRSVPEGVSYEVVNVSDVPVDRTFRDAWKTDGGKIKTDLPKAKLIAHDKRRRARTLEMSPWDLKATIPSEAEAAEAEREKLRKKYADVQTSMDEAKSEKKLKELVLAL